MSPTTDNFIHSLVEMSKAFEELPGVKAEAEERARQTEMLAKQVQDREESILRLKAELEQAHEARRKVEAERDDAELRFLELDEKAHKALAALGNIMANVNDATRDLTPPTPVEPVAASWAQPIPTPPAEQEHHYEPFPTEAPQQGQSEQHPTTTAATENTANPVEVPKSDANPPSDASAHTTDGSQSPNASSQTVSNLDTATPQPYAGKRYYDHPTYLSREAWHAGGGSDADYDWRPGRSVGF